MPVRPTRPSLSVLGVSLAACLGLAVVSAAAAQAGAKTLDFKPHQIVTMKQANKHLDGSPRAFKRFVVRQVVKTKKQAAEILGEEGYAAQVEQCQQAGVRPASMRVHGYHRRGIALATINQCVLTVDGGPVVLKRVDETWRMRYLGSAAITCQQLSGHKVPRALWLTMTPSGECLDEESGESADYQS